MCVIAYARILCVVLLYLFLLSVGSWFRNHNYSNEVVRHLEPVDTEGARNTTIYANNGETDPVAEGAMTLMDTRSVASGSVAGGSRAGSVMNSHMASPNKRR